MEKTNKTNSINGMYNSNAIYVTVSKPAGAVETETLRFLVSAEFSEEIYNTLQKCTPYTLLYGKTIALSPITLESACEALRIFRYHRVEYVHKRTFTKVLNLPEGITFDDGALCIDSDFKECETDPKALRREVKLSSWILEHFPNAVYSRTRARFKLPIETEETESERGVIKTSIVYSMSGNTSLEVITRVFEKKYFEI